MNITKMRIQWQKAECKDSEIMQGKRTNKVCSEFEVNDAIVIALS